MAIDGIDLPSILLDPQNEDEVITQAYERIRSASGNTITDFNPSSPIAALIEGQTYVYMELLWFLNQLPEALALEVLRLSGVTRSPGTKAKGRAVFLLRSSQASDFEVSAGYFIPYKEAGFETTVTLVIPAGSIEASVPIEAIREGSDMNVDRYSLATTTTGLSYLQSIYNTDPITGGTDLEPLPETLRRAQIALRTREVLVTTEDYETKAQELLGFGSTATAYPLLSSDKETEKAGNLHVFLADTQGKPPSLENCQSIQKQLKDLSFAGSSIWVSPVVLQQITIDAVVSVDQLSQDTADAVFGAVKDYLSPSQFTLGTSVRLKELEYLIRSTEGIREVVSVLIDSQAVNLPMPNQYTTPDLEVLSLTMTDATGLTFTYYLGDFQDYRGDAP